MEGGISKESPMLKNAIIAAAILVATGGTMMWVTSHASPRDVPQAVASGMPSIEELHARAARQNLPILEVKEPY
jgi:hypothetical protein